MSDTTNDNATQGKASYVDSERAELHALLLERAFRFGDFTLSSGRKSTFYFNGKQVTLDGRGLQLVASLVLHRCREVGAEIIGGLTLGADPIAAAVIALSAERGDGPSMRAFIVRKEAKVHGTEERLEGPPLHRGDRVVLIDDTTTTGGSYLAAADALEGTGAEIIEAIVVVDREEGAREALAARNISLHALFTRSEFLAPTKSA